MLYCVEAVDHPGTGIDALHIDTQMPFDSTFEPNTLGGVVTLRGTAHVTQRDACWDAALYQRLEQGAPPASSLGNTVGIVAIPYFTWQNRGASPMAVWLPQTQRA